MRVLLTTGWTKGSPVVSGAAQWRPWDLICQALQRLHPNHHEGFGFLPAYVTSKASSVFPSLFPPALLPWRGPWWTDSSVPQKHPYATQVPKTGVGSYGNNPRLSYLYHRWPLKQALDPQKLPPGAQYNFRTPLSCPFLHHKSQTIALTLFQDEIQVLLLHGALALEEGLGFSGDGSKRKYFLRTVRCTRPVRFSRALELQIPPLRGTKHLPSFSRAPPAGISFPSIEAPSLAPQGQKQSRGFRSKIFAFPFLAINS